MTDKKLTVKERAFVEHYVANGGNGTEAAKAAGYSVKTAKEVASQNLTKLHIKQYLCQLQKPIQEGRLATIEQRRELYRRVALGEEKDVAIVQGAQIEVAPKMADRLKALDSLAKTHGDFQEKIDLTSDGKPIQPTRIIVQAVAAKNKAAK